MTHHTFSLHPSKLYVLPLILILCGCGNYFSVKIPYYLPDNKNAVEVKKALSALYIVVKAAPEPEENLVGSLLKQRDTGFAPAALAAKIARALSRPGTEARAWRVSRGEEKTDPSFFAKASKGRGPAKLLLSEADPYARYFAPAGILEIKVSDPFVSARKEERASYYTGKDKQRQEVKTTVWEYSASLTADIKLLSAPEAATLDKLTETFGVKEDRPDNKADIGEWYRDRQEKLFNAAAAKLAGRYTGRPVLRLRPVFRKKGDDESSKAADLAFRDKWPQAEALWNRRLGAGGGWRDMLGLGVAAEVRKDFAAARGFYLKAREASAGEKDAKNVRWKEILSDLELMLSTGAAAAAPERDWFAVPAAVLPFADETTSIDGPPMVRTLFYEALKAGGYRVQDPAETERLLLAHGFTQGGQLGAADPAELCRWLGVERLFFGDISAFGEIMAGLYNKRLVQGRISLWDLREENFIWSAEPSVVKVSTPKSLLGGLFSQLARGLVERIKNKPLAYEGTLFAAGAAAALPNRPPKADGGLKD